VFCCCPGLDSVAAAASLLRASAGGVQNFLFFSAIGWGAVCISSSIQQFFLLELAFWC